MNTRGARPLRRMPPLMRTTQYKTFQIVSPLSTHHRRATCQEIDCPDYLNGWRVRVEIHTEAQIAKARKSGRKHTVLKVAEGETWLVFEAGQSCFYESTHTVSVGRPEIYLAGRGDWRSYNPRVARRHANSDDWLDEFRNNQDRLQTLLERG